MEENKIIETLLNHEGRIDKIIEILLNHEGRLERIEENMVTKEDHQEVMNALDRLVALAEKKDQELLMMARGMKRQDEKIDTLDDRVNGLEKDVGQIKTATNLA